MTKIFTILALAVLGAFAFAGCTPMNEDESTIPWSQPASWEDDKSPMMGR